MLIFISIFKKSSVHQSCNFLYVETIHSNNLNTISRLKVLHELYVRICVNNKKRRKAKEMEIKQLNLTETGFKSNVFSSSFSGRKKLKLVGIWKMCKRQQ